MSLILEALRKSEAERRRGLPPDLRAELPPAPARRGRAGIIGAAAVGAVLVALAAWFGLREPASPGVVERPDPRTTPSAPASRQTQSALPARTPEAPAVGPSVERPASPSPSETAVAEGEPRSAPAGLPAPPPDTTQVSSAPAAGNAEPAPPLPPPSDVATGKPDTAAGEGRILSLAELDPGTRDALPPLKLTMHLWNPEPERRFVILDGQRLGEGDRIGEARIARIERDGVLLEWHGRGIHVPVR